VHADGTNLTQLVKADCGHPVFSPDGTRVACGAFIPNQKKRLVELAVVAVN